MSQTQHLLDALWDFDDPAASLARLEAAADGADPLLQGVLATQRARALGLLGRFEEGHAALAEIEPAEAAVEVTVRVLLERGRLVRSAGDPRAAREPFAAAARAAEAAGLEFLHVDALHMVALVADPAEQGALTEHALAVAATASSERARRWEASLLHNLGMVHATALRWEEALDCFQRAHAARADQGDDAAERVARWMVGWALRHLGRRREALALQEGLAADLTVAGAHDPYVEEELALLRVT